MANLERNPPIPSTTIVCPPHLAMSFSDTQRLFNKVIHVNIL
jgi:hypothetical protein